MNQQQSMFFLIEYDRSSGQLVTLQTFDSAKRQRATDLRVKVELRLHRSGIDREVVLLKTPDRINLIYTDLALALSTHFESG